MELDRKLLERKTSADGEGYVSLYMVTKNTGIEFVTWISSKVHPDSTCFGHYFTSVLDAVSDYQGRS